VGRQREIERERAGEVRELVGTPVGWIMYMRWTSAGRGTALEIIIIIII